MRITSKRPTMRDVAIAAGVSFKTVSRVVNGEVGVSPDLVARVERAIAELRYQPDERARNLRQGDARTGAIGFVMVDVSNPFFSSILRGLEDVAREQESLVLAGSSDGDITRQHRLIEDFVARRVDGLVVVTSGQDLGPLAEEIERGTPVVFLDLEPPQHDCDLVRSDHRGGARLITEHLLARGHTDIAFLSDDPAVFSASERLAGFREAMAAAGLRAHEHWQITKGTRPEEWEALVTELLSAATPPTALVTAQNFITLGAVRALHRLNLHRQVALIGFDDIDFADIVEPGISVVPQQPLLLGRRAGEILFERLAGATYPPVREIIASDVIGRGSGEIPPSTGSPV
jgi:LacI family transcriptional regulator